MRILAGHGVGAGLRLPQPESRLPAGHAPKADGCLPAPRSLSRGPAGAAIASRYKLAILSNGSPRMLAAVVESTGLKTVFADVISVDEVKIFKPSPRVYELAPRHLKVPQDAIGFISSNFWDIAGAKSFGLWTCWINRAKAPEEELGHPAGCDDRQPRGIAKSARVGAACDITCQGQEAFLPTRASSVTFPPSRLPAFPGMPRCLPGRRRPWNSSP